MDRPYSYYSTVPIELNVRPSHGKQYSTMYINQDGRDVMILRNFGGRSVR